MNKAELTTFVSNSTGLTKLDAAKAIGATLDGIATALSNGDTVTLSDFGTFSVKDRAARVGRNPSTGESIDIAASKVVKFKAGKNLKSLVK